MKDHIREAVDKLPLSAPPPFESAKEEDRHHYLTQSYNHLEGDGTLINPWLIMRMRVEKGKGELLWEPQGSSQDTVWCLVADIDVLEDHYNSKSGHSLEGRNLLKVNIFEEAPPELGASSVLMKHGDSYICYCCWHKNCDNK